MFDKQQRKLRRSATLIAVLSKYGFQDLLIRMNLTGSSTKESADVAATLSWYERVRLALEELGPTFVKLGQSFSDREDLLPIELIEQLRKLQDNVETLDLDVKAIMEQELNINVDDHFQYIDAKPLAAASIAQVYKGRLKDGQDVIIKVRRPNVESLIKDDLLLLKDVVALIDTYSEVGDRINLKNAVLAFEKSLHEELSLLNEKHNIQHFARNFEDNPETYVPKVYDDYCTDTILTMEFIDGIKVTDVETLKANGIDPIEVSEKGYRLFVSQMLDYGVFHADPHAGNIMVLKDGRVVFIDFGAIGIILENDKSVLESLILNFMYKKPQQIVRSLKKLSIYYNIPDERKFESDVLEILNFVHNASLKDIKVADILNKMKDVLKENRLVMPDYFYLLFKGISLMDGVGRQINPDLDVVKSLKPYTKKIILRKLSPDTFAKKGLSKATDFLDNIDEIPNELRSILNKLDENKFSVSTEISNFDKIDSLVKKSIFHLILGLILSANIIGTAILWASQTGPHMGSVAVLPILGILISIGLIVTLILSMLRR